MPITVWGAFDKFRKDTVDLDSAESDKARTSRDYLFGQPRDLNSLDSDCPKISTYLPYGSFARKTKIRPVDDIDLLAMVAGTGLRSQQKSTDPYVYSLVITDTNAALARFNDGTGNVSSTKLVNQIKKSLGKVINYSKAEINRNQQAVSAYLDSSKIEFYLIPNGYGHWMRSDPRKDTESVTRVNKKHNGNLLPTMRLLKYWNWRTHKPRLSSYYFETLALKVFENAPTIDSFPKAIRYFFSFCPIYLDFACSDPKVLGPDLDKDVASDTKKKVKDAMKEAELASGEAIAFESLSRQEFAINCWKKVFGPSFPGYGL
jgi:hypothetical protein